MNKIKLMENINEIFKSHMFELIAPWCDLFDAHLARIKLQRSRA